MSIKVGLEVHSHREVPIHRTTQHMNGSNINAMRIQVNVGTQTSELI